MSARYGPVKWAATGMHVFLPWSHENNGTALRCTVAVAAGDAARVVNEKYGVDRWVHLDNLLVPPGDDHGYGSLSEDAVG